ncbi:MAG: hypothetical protein ABJA50_06645 [Chloroflexota bacterium]
MILSSQDYASKHKTELRYHLDIPVLIVATTAITLAMFAFGLLGSGGHLASPLDDTYIHLQYARQLAGGHPFQYNTGDIPSSGDSSFLYPFLLAPVFLLGFNGGAPLLFAFLLGFVAHLVTVIFLYKLALLVFNRPSALLAASFYLLDGRSNWHFSTGMETGLYAGALIAFFYVWTKGTPNARFVLTALVGAFVALLRTEGHVVISVVCLATLFYLWRGRRLSVGAVWLLLPIAIGLVPYALNIALTGYWQYNTSIGKASFFIPYIPFSQALEIIPTHIIDLIKDGWLGIDIPYSPFPLLITFPIAALGARYGLQSSRYKLLTIVMLSGFVLGIVFAMIPKDAHFDRYFQPYDTIIWFFFAAGLVWAIGKAQRLFNKPEAAENNIHSIKSRTTYAWVVGIIVLFMLPQFFRFFFLLGDSDRHTYYQQVAFSDWIRNNTPVDARIGVNDVGAHKYWGDRYITDLVGLADNDLRGVFFSGWGSIYDVLMRRPEEKRPQYMLIYPNTFINDTDTSVGQSLLTSQYSITIQNVDTTAPTTEVFYKVNWDKAALSQENTYLLHKGAPYLDSINIGDLIDEKDHNYALQGREPTVAEPKSILTSSIYDDGGAGLTDSSRRHSGFEQFTVKSVPGQSLTLVSRSMLVPDGSQHLKVLANGKEVGIWDAHNTRAGLWQEYEYTIPAQFVTSDHTTLTIDSSFDPGGPGFISYRYWVYAP